MDSTDRHATRIRRRLQRQADGAASSLTYGTPRLARRAATALQAAGLTVQWHGPRSLTATLPPDPDA